MADAGYSNGFDAGLMYCDSSYANMAEVIVDSLQRSASDAAAADRAGRLFRRLLRQESTLTGSCRGRAAPLATPRPGLAVFVVKGGALAYGSYPDIDALFPQQADELDPKKRTAILDKMQQLVYEKAILRADLAARLSSTGLGPRVGRVGVWPDPGLCLHRPVRGHHDQGGLVRSKERPKIQPESEEAMKQYIARRRSAMRCCRCFCCR